MRMDWRMTTAAAAIAAFALAALDLRQTTNAADEYPTRPVRVIVPFPAGGINDVLGRVWANAVAPHLGTVIVENRGGGGSMIGSTEVARAAPDGYTLLVGNSTNQLLNPQLMKSPPFNPETDFTAVAILALIPNVIAVHPSLSVNSLKELADYARQNPGKLSYGSAGVGTMTHLSGELFKKQAGNLDMVHVPYRGGAPGTSDLTGGTIPVMSLSMASQLLALHAAGKLRILCVNAPSRLAIAPDIPTAAEAGYPGMVVQVFNGIFAPAATPKPTLDRIARESRKAMATDEVGKVLGAAGATIVADSTPEQAVRFVKEERDRWTRIIKASGIEPR